MLPDPDPRYFAACEAASVVSFMLSNCSICGWCETPERDSGDVPDDTRVTL